MSPRKPTAEKPHPVAVYVPEEIYERLEAAAKADHRSISALVNLMIKHSLDCHIWTQGHVPKP